MKTKRVRYIVYPSTSRWAIKRDGIVLGSDFETQREAVAFAAERARAGWEQNQTSAELQIRGRNGKIRDSRTYGNDPRKTKG